jgi:AcrR family transcriptional regulator
MSPRRYTMKNREDAAAETRRRIVESTLELHSRNGVLGTSWKDIAAHADVSVGTVYKHFPTLDALLPACGALMMERFRPPSPEEAGRIAGESADPAQRLRRVVGEVFSFYDRAGPAAEVDPRERKLESIREWEAYWAETIAAFLGAALAPLAPSDQAIAFAGGLLDQRAFAAFRARGISTDVAITEVTRMILAWLALNPSEPRQ